MKITISPSKTADTRSTDVPVTKEMLLASSHQHIGDVRKALTWMSHRLDEVAHLHDYTKVDEKGINQFFEDFKAIQEKRMSEFKKLPWYQRHITEERHHLLEHVPEDVNLFDVLEMVADIVMAGMARSGKIYDAEISSEVLVKAFKNTVELLKSNTIVKDA